jgi:hypothetical protein
MTQFNDEVFRSSVRTLLHEGVVDVSFTKKDGTDRLMKCTLNLNKIPKEFTPKGTGQKMNDESIAVFDVEVNGWRSFRWESLKTAKLTVE